MTDPQAAPRPLDLAGLPKPNMTAEEHIAYLAAVFENGDDSPAMTARSAGAIFARLRDLLAEARSLVPAQDPLTVGQLVAAIDAVVNAPGSGVWIDYSGKARTKRGGIPAARRKFAAAILAALRAASPAPSLGPDR